MKPGPDLRISSRIESHTFASQAVQAYLFTYLLIIFPKKKKDSHFAHTQPLLGKTKFALEKQNTLPLFL